MSTDHPVLQNTAGGGYGPPDARDRDRVLSDLPHGYITQGAAREIYKLA